MKWPIGARSRCWGSSSTGRNERLDRHVSVLITCDTEGASLRYAVDKSRNSCYTGLRLSADRHHPQVRHRPRTPSRSPAPTCCTYLPKSLSRLIYGTHVSLSVDLIVVSIYEAMAVTWNKCPGCGRHPASPSYWWSRASTLSVTACATPWIRKACWRAKRRPRDGLCIAPGANWSMKSGKEVQTTHERLSGQGHDGS